MGKERLLYPHSSASRANEAFKIFAGTVVIKGKPLAAPAALLKLRTLSIAPEIKSYQLCRFLCTPPLYIITHDFFFFILLQVARWQRQSRKNMTIQMIQSKSLWWVYLSIYIRFLSLSFSVVINKCVAHLKNPISHFILSPPYQSIQQCNLIVFFVTCAICILTCLLGEL